MAEVDEELLEQFKTITNGGDEPVLRTFLAAAENDLENAIAMYFAAGHEAVQPNTMGGSGQATEREPPENAHHDHDEPNEEPPPRPARRLGPLAFTVRAAQTVLSTALRTADWVISLILPGHAYGILRGFFISLLGGDPLASSRHMSSMLAQAYGEAILRFRDGHWQQAYQSACQQGKPLLVYLHSDRSVGTADFCSQALCDPEIVSFANANFVCWAAPMDSAAATQLVGALQVRACPYLAALAPSPDTNAGASSAVQQSQEVARIRVLGALQGVIDGPLAQRVMTVLRQATRAHAQMSAEATRRQQAAVAAAVEARSLREEQDAALAASMEEDRRRAEAAAHAAQQAEAARKAEEEAERAVREEQEKKLQAVEDRRNAIVERRRQKRATLPTEPPASDGSDASGTPATTLIRVRLPHGASSQRRFEDGTGVSAVYDWVDSLDDIDVWDYVLTNTYPRREFSREDGDVTLREAGLVPNAAIMVIAQDN